MKQTKNKLLFKPLQLVLFCFFAMAFCNISNAQSVNVKGTITDNQGVPLTGASIIVKGTSKGATADFDGSYTLTDVDTNGIIIISYVGYKTKEIPVNGQTTLSVQLEEDLATLDQVVVVGYGSQKRSQITGAVETIDTEALTRTNTASIDNALQGLAAGVSVTSNNATPGGGVSVRIRGAGGVNGSEPLYVIDGFPISVGGNENSSPLSSINPQDIKSITVLKDAASAAIYGTRAANGVVLITTKRGRTSQKGVVSINTRTGFQRVANTLDLMDAQTFVRTTNLAYQNAGRAIAPGFDNPESFGVGTDWIDTITQTAQMSDIQASFSGGSETSNFFLSLGRFKQEGIVKGSSFERISTRINADKRISEKLKVGASIGFTRSKQDGLGASRGTNTVLSLATLFYPTIPVYDANGNYAPTPANGFYKPQVNPLFTAEGPTTPPIRNNFQGNIYAQYKIIPNLEFKTSGFYTFNNTVSENYGRIFDLGAAASTEQSIAKSQVTSSTFLIENTLNYTINANSHSIGLLAGHSLQRSRFQRLAVSGENANEGEPLVVTNLTQNLQITDFISEESLLSYFGKVNYSYMGKYLMTAIVRRDASSKFGRNNRWGTFPSLSLGWRISDENFMPKETALSGLKLRAGWGQVGADNIQNYLFSPVVVQGFNYPFGNQDGVVLSGSATQGIANPDLKWETVTQYSVGIDADFFDNRLNLVAEYYNKTQEDVLVGVPQSAVTGISNGKNQGSQRQNIGELVNKGFEFSANYAGKVGELEFSVGANLTTIQNEILNVPAAINNYNFRGGNLTRTENGRSIGEFYGLVADGIFQTQAEVTAHATQNVNNAPGDIRYKDISGPDGTPDGIIDDNDRTFIGSPIPDFIYGFNLNLQYKNFDFSLQGTGMSGNDVYNISKVLLTDYTRSENKLNITPWSTSNSNASYPRAIAQDVGNSQNSSFYVEDGSFTRIKVIELGYSLPTNLLDKLGISQVRLYGNVLNPFTFTNYSGTDPEVGNANGSNLAAGIDNFVYPIARVFSVGLNAKF
ncbi:SusC/RagA family TonB-linked outer membrane protein [Flavivirga algicola]|uniref:TonB-dependent receptor n=1 Tax=Flavivirga algicola TaxID=2729136 RepID=A0ABX1RR58_9FLAO|nr:TonB-dependent receptor [Flavivirga algicola]NMH86026.1 TonB-dependent receptor [Flavivirga algicola]